MASFALKQLRRFVHAGTCFLAAFLLTVTAGAQTNVASKKPSKTKKQRIVEPAEPPGPAAPKMPKSFHLLAEGEIPLAAKGATVIDGLSARPLYEKNAAGVFFPASTTKIMTALLVIEAGNLEQEVEITPEDAAVGESSLDINVGERFTRRQMLFGLMLKSANDVAHALGRDNAGTAAAFAKKMTQRAWELGATSTRFMNAHGLHHPQHFTTAHDLALIARAAMQQPYFRRVVSTLKHPWVTNLALRELRNHNRLLTQFPGCTGIKTGYTRPAQQVLASAAMRDGREVIAVVMHTHKPGIWEDSKLLLTYGFDHPPADGVRAE